MFQNNMCTETTLGEFAISLVLVKFRLNQSMLKLKEGISGLLKGNVFTDGNKTSVPVPIFLPTCRDARFTKSGKRLHEFQQWKQFRLHGTSRFEFFIRQISKITIFFLKNSLKNVLCAKIRNSLVGCCDRTHFKLLESDCNMRRLVHYQHYLQLQNV